MISFKKNDVIIVTGASSGLGQSTAIQLNELGATVIAIARNKERLNETKLKCKYPDNFHIEVKDLTEKIEELPVYIKELKNKYGKFTGLAYCAGVANIAPLQAIDLTKAKEIFDINYFAPLFMVKGFCDRRNNIGKGASIVVISSISGVKSDKGHGVYGGSKAAIAASMKSFAREVSETQGIRINCVSPSDIKTPLTAHKIEQENSKYPFGCGEATDVSNMIVFLLSYEAKWINTQNYIIDCGYM